MRRGGRSRLWLFAVLGLSLTAACSSGQPDAASKQAHDMHSLYMVTLWLAVVVFIGVEGAILWAVLRYRKKPHDDTLPPQVHGNTALEVVWFLIPLVIVVILFTLSTRTLARVDAKAVDPTVRVTVEGFQWQWNFTYPDDGFTVRGTVETPPEMVLPVNETIHIDEVSNDVIHSFYVPAFLFKRDVIPGRNNNFDFNPDKVGTYSGQCAEFCGLLHNKMTFSVRVVERPEYNKWVTDQKAAEAARLAACGDPTDDVKLVAKSIAFTRPCFSLPTKAPFKIEFDNQDAGVSHNVAIYKTKAESNGGTPLLRGEIFQGAKAETYVSNAGPPTVLVPAPDGLNAGEYYFRCDVHPGMNGTVLVK